MEIRTRYLVSFLAGFILACSIGGAIVYHYASEYQAEATRRIGQLGGEIERARDLERQARDLLASSKSDIRVLRKLVELYFPVP